MWMGSKLAPKREPQCPKWHQFWTGLKQRYWFLQRSPEVQRPIIRCLDVKCLHMLKKNWRHKFMEESSMKAGGHKAPLTSWATAAGSWGAVMGKHHSPFLLSLLSLGTHCPLETGQMPPWSHLAKTILMFSVETKASREIVQQDLLAEAIGQDLWSPGYCPVREAWLSDVGSLFPPICF